ncbi:MAG TPA: DUF1269 domain-containing protein [Verrucomicrobiota bacterium]|nr:DUF1269 domain-containing protein [Verrucomicrobiota bacterium]
MTVPAKIDARPTHKNRAMINLNVLAFDNATQAFRLRDAMVDLQGESLFDLVDAVVVTRDASGKVQLHQSASVVAGCASAGSVAGLILGAIFMLPWAGSAVGAGVGAVFGALSDLGVNDRFAKDLGAALRPGTSALALLGSKTQLDRLGEKIGPLLRGCTLLHTTVDTDREVEIRKFLETHRT